MTTTTERTERTSGTITEIVWTARDGETVAAFAVQHDTAAHAELFGKPIEAWSAPHLGIHRPVPVSAAGSGPCRLLKGGPCAHTTSGAVDAVKLLVRWREAEQDDEVIADELADLLRAETETATGKDEAPVYPAPGSTIPGQPGFVVGYCSHRVAGSEWRAGFRVCERCPSNEG